MSHELRTPLNAVLGFSEVLLERMFGDINERQEEYLRDIHGSGQHLLELLNEILDLSKVEAGHMQMDLTTFPVREALDYSLGLLRERALAHHVELVQVVDTGVGVVEADELRFKQIVLNLVTNAVKFTPEGGRIVVHASSHDGELQISVADTGIGVPEEDRERIFESFQQGGLGATNEEGTGLGLTLCRRMLELLGGRIWVESEVGKGSRFTFSLPLGSPGVKAARFEERIPAGGVRSVVLIDDDRPSLDLLSAYLEGAQWHVSIARDGVEGLTTVRQVDPAVVILDIRLPRVDGWNVLRALKADPTTAQIPVVVVSIVDERAKGLALGAAGISSSRSDAAPCWTRWRP